MAKGDGREVGFQDGGCCVSLDHLTNIKFLLRSVCYLILLIKQMQEFVVSSFTVFFAKSLVVSRNDTGNTTST